jgi:hypothetical protein
MYLCLILHFRWLRVRYIHYAPTPPRQISPCDRCISASLQAQHLRWDSTSIALDNFPL